MKEQNLLNFSNSCLYNQVKQCNCHEQNCNLVRICEMTSIVFFVYLSSHFQIFKKQIYLLSIINKSNSTCTLYKACVRVQYSISLLNFLQIK